MVAFQVYEVYISKYVFYVDVKYNIITSTEVSTIYSETFREVSERRQQTCKNCNTYKYHFPI